MSWKERQTLTVLSTILAVLFAILLIVLGIRYRETRAELEALNKPVVKEEIVVEDSVYFSGLTYHNGKTTLTFSLNEEGKWIWADDPTFPLNDSTVLSILGVLTDWHPRYTLDDEEAYKGAELYRPTGTLTATTSEGTVVTLLFGKPTDDGTAHYVRVNNEENRVHVVDDSVYNLLCVPIYDMMDLPELPAMAEESLISILVQGPAPMTMLTAHRTEGASATSWRWSGEDVTRELLVRNLVSELQRLAPDKCVLFRPSEAAVSICGFDKPTATVDVTYAEEGEPHVLKLTVGAKLPDGSGYYVRLNEDSTIYRVPAAPLETTLSLAFNGFVGAMELASMSDNP